MSDTELNFESRNRNRSRSPIERNRSEFVNNDFTIFNNLIKSELTDNSNHIKNIFTMFKVEYLNIVPEFQGDPALLTEFINSSEQLIQHFYDPQNANNFQNILLLKSIRNKIKGEAATNLAAYNISTWQELKDALLASYADKRDHQTLIMELCTLKQNNLKPIDFFSKIQSNLNLQTSYIKTHTNDVNEVTCLIEFSQKLALRVLLKNLNSPLNDYLSTRNPSSLNEALNILSNDFNANEIKNQNLFKQKPNMFMNKSGFKQPQNFNQANNFQRENYLKYNSQKPEGTNVFKPNKNYVPSKPVPMSTSTRNFYSQQINNSGNRNFKPAYRPQPRWTSEELHNNDTGPEPEFEDSDREFQYFEPEMFENEESDFLDSEASGTQT